MIVIVGAGTIYLLSFRSSPNAEQSNLVQNNIEPNNQEEVNAISSNETTVSDAENENRESESFDNTQMYFENIEKLYPYLNYNQVEDIKIRVQTYVHDFVNQNILDCKLNPQSILENKDEISFEINLDNSLLRVAVKTNENDEILNISIVHDVVK